MVSFFVAEHQVAEYIMQIIRLETNTSRPPEEVANESGGIGIFIPRPSCAEKSLSGFPLLHSAAMICISRFSLPSLSPVCAEKRQPAMLTKPLRRLTPQLGVPKSAKY